MKLWCDVIEPKEKCRGLCISRFKLFVSAHFNYENVKIGFNYLFA